VRVDGISAARATLEQEIVRQSAVADEPPQVKKVPEGACRKMLIDHSLGLPEASSPHASPMRMPAGGADSNCSGGGFGQQVQAKANQQPVAAAFGGCGMSIKRSSHLQRQTPLPVAMWVALMQQQRLATRCCLIRLLAHDPYHYYHPCFPA
jgi:hypothetical protein